MSSVLVTGSARGLGLELVNQLLLLPPADIATVFLTSRAQKIPETAQKVIEASSGRARYVTLDVGNDDSVAQAVKDVQAHLGGSGLDMIINNAAISPQDGTPSQNTIASLEKTFATNVSSVQRMTTAFLPLLEKGQKKKIMNITSTLGSIGLIKNFALAPTPSYKVSKAALNMLTSLWALELEPKGFTVFAISPGWLRTELGGADADLDVTQGASQVVKILMEASLTKDSGSFRDVFVEGHPTYTGKNPPW